MNSLLRRVVRIGGRAGAGLFALLLPAPAFAHAFGQQYTLPLPVSFYALGASLALVASFIILSLFTRRSAGAGIIERVYVLPQWIQSRAATIGLKSFGVFVLCLAIVTGFFGSSDVTKNPALFLFWVGLLLIVVYASAIVSGLWERLDPFRTSVESVLGRAYPPLIQQAPKWLRYVPAILFFYFLLWFELLSYGQGAVPHNVALLLIGYLGVTYFGVAVLGNEWWFRYGDFFSVFYGIAGRFAPFALSEEVVRVSPPGERLLEEHPDSVGLLVFILLILSSTAYDGLRETLPWVRFFSAHPFLTDHYVAVSLIGLLISPFVFFACYALAVYFMRLLSGGGYRALLLRFGLSLVPIAVAYNVAHYFSLVVSEGQNMIPVLSDPLGQGLNLFGTAAYVYNPGLIGAKAVWYTQVAVILIGHIMATYIAHRIALHEFPSRSRVILSQIPMLALMVLYTCFGLWVLSLPYAA